MIVKPDWTCKTLTAWSEKYPGEYLVLVQLVAELRKAPAERRFDILAWLVKLGIETDVI